LSQVTLGRLERVELRDIWMSEASHFTPWLARSENLEVLGETLGLELELEAQERAVGPFRADILCKDIGRDQWVLIENQLEKTDHVHLGQLLTYASGLEAVTIIWVAARFTEEHRSTLDWLNRITNESFRFFGVEVELWRIGGSPAAPKFNIVSKPNDWSQAVAHAARAIDDAELTDTRKIQRDYWDGLHQALREVAGAVRGDRKPQPQSWMAYPVGRTGFHLSAVMIRPKRQVRAELYIAGDSAKLYLAELMVQRAEIEHEFGEQLTWEDLPTRRDCRVAIYLNDVDPEDQADWARQHRWLADKLNRMHRVFSKRVPALRADSGFVAEADAGGDVV
jgi:hypothetical protein